MTNKINYPFALVNVFFVCLDFQRQPAVPNEIALGIVIEIKVVAENFPGTMQVNIKISSHEGDPLKLSMELVSLFNYTGNNPDQDKEKFIDFLNDRGFIMVWPYLNQMLKFITSQMGMQPLNVNFPPEFNLDPNSLQAAGPQK